MSNCELKKLFNNDYLNVLFKMKKLNEKYISFFHNISNVINETDNEIYDELNKLYSEYNIFEEKNDFLNKKTLAYKNTSLQYMNKVINKKIIQCCNHEFVEDYIDTFPDRSLRIIYCNICENSLYDCNTVKND